MDAGGRSKGLPALKAIYEARSVEGVQVRSHLEYILCRPTLEEHYANDPLRKSPLQFRAAAWGRQYELEVNVKPVGQFV